ncbi:hypothetical protein EDD29_7440 [Actinocorallia herbida]|uniref:Uncharacterized protein n=1 Tax=Actinocorallia herbida TaxID=58109 RepID=A0A3N1D863_9ACTN|nr:hypothetical protein EDD29_7440 [Actinocorallia herbida]
MTAVERVDGWVFAWGGKWAAVGQVERVAEHIARVVAA